MFKHVVALVLCLGLAQQQSLADSERRGGSSSSSSFSLVCIGDSLSDVGNTYELTGESWPVKKVYPRQAFSNAFTWVNYLASTTVKSSSSDDDDDDDDDDHGNHGPGHTRRLEDLFEESLKESEESSATNGNDHHRLRGGHHHHRDHHEHDSEEHAARKESWLAKWREHHGDSEAAPSNKMAKWHALTTEGKEAAKESWMAAIASWRALKGGNDDKKGKKFSKVYNHAVGGATSDSAFIQGYTGPTTSWPVNGGKQQLEMFLLKRALEKRKDDGKNIFLIWLGANDFFYRWVAGQSLSDTAFLTALAKKIGGLVSTIAANYNKTSVVVLNAYPLETVPFMQPYLTPDVLNATDKFNTILTAQLGAVRANLTANVQLLEVDATSVLRTAIKTAPAGVSTNSTCVVGDVTTSAVTVCAQPNRFVFYDTFHPTEWIHRAVAKAVAAKLT